MTLSTAKLDTILFEYPQFLWIMDPIDVKLGLTDLHVLVTGAGGQIGSGVVSAFLSAGARVTCLDNSSARLRDLLSSQSPEDYARIRIVKADITDELRLEEYFQDATDAFGPIQCCVALAALDLSVLEHHTTICDMPAAQFKRTLDVNVFGTFLTVRTWARLLRNAATSGVKLPNVSLIIVGSESGAFGERGNADYATSKSAVQVGMLQSLKQDVPRVYPGARVNAIAPGPVDTPQFRRECEANPDQLYHDAEATMALGRPVSIAAVARTIVFLASELSSDIHGQVLHVDGGKQGKLVFEKGEAAQYQRKG